MRRSTFTPVLLAALAACGSEPAGVVCTDEARPGIIVNVRHAVTGEPSAEGAVLTLTDGAFEQVVDQTTIGQLTLYGAVERPGSYDARVEKTGFHTWEREQVSVDRTDDGCHVVTVVLEAALEPLD